MLGACRQWAREELPRRLDAKARLLHGLHAGAYLPSPMATAFEHPGLSPRSCSSVDTPRSASPFSFSSRSLAASVAPASTRLIASRAARSSGDSAGTSCAYAGCRACKAAGGERGECRSRTRCSAVFNVRGVCCAPGCRREWDRSQCEKPRTCDYRYRTARPTDRTMRCLYVGIFFQISTFQIPILYFPRDHTSLSTSRSYPS